MRDINTALLTAYYSALQGVGVPIYEGEEPDDVKDPIYIVMSDAVGFEQSTKNSSDCQYTLQLSIHSWKYKYNNSADLNDVASAVFDAIKPNSNSVLDLSGEGLQMMNLQLQTDRTERIGEMGGRVYISRILIFKQDIFVIS